MNEAIQQKFVAIRDELCAGTIEREGEVDLVMTGCIAQEHVNLVGVPGTAKSMILEAMVKAVNGSRFSTLLSKFSVPEEVCGPVSVIGLQNDEYRRITTGKMPECEMVFLDEVYKASSAILNTVLTILNERQYHNNGHIMDCPLLLCVGASNEWPTSENGGADLGALFDRFLLRRQIKPIATAEGLERLLWGNVGINVTTHITGAEIREANKDSLELPWTEPAVKAVLGIIEKLRAEGIVTGDRRLRKSMAACGAFAYLNGAKEITTDHLEILIDCLWVDPEEQPAKVSQIVLDIANPVGVKVAGHMMEIAQVRGKFKPNDMDSILTTENKYKEIATKLRQLHGERAERAYACVRQEMAKLREAALDLNSMDDMLDDLAPLAGSTTTDDKEIF